MSLFAKTLRAVTAIKLEATPFICKVRANVGIICVNNKLPNAGGLEQGGRPDNRPQIETLNPVYRVVFSKPLNKTVGYGDFGVSSVSDMGNGLIGG